MTLVREVLDHEVAYCGHANPFGGAAGLGGGQFGVALHDLALGAVDQPVQQVICLHAATLAPRHLDKRPLRLVGAGRRREPERAGGRVR